MSDPLVSGPAPLDSGPPTVSSEWQRAIQQYYQSYPLAPSESRRPPIQPDEGYHASRGFPVSIPCRIPSVKSSQLINRLLFPSRQRFQWRGSGRLERGCRPRMITKDKGMISRAFSSLAPLISTRSETPPEALQTLNCLLEWQNPSIRCTCRFSGTLAVATACFSLRYPTLGSARRPRSMGSRIRQRLPLAPSRQESLVPKRHAKAR